MSRPLIAALLVGAALVVAPAATAHQGNPDFRSVVRSIEPATPGLRVQVLNEDDRLELENRSGRTVVIEGYDGEPYARIAADGTVEVNRRSPALFLNEDRFAHVRVPDDADPEAPPRWRRVDGSGRFEWHDHRAHWMATALPPQVKDRSKRTKIDDWSVPIAVGATRGAIRGDLHWQPEDQRVPLGAYGALAAVALAALGLVVGVRRRRGRAGGDGGGEAW